jgi:hypothetical protein
VVSLYDYRRSASLAADDAPFAALVMAAMRRADTGNLARLREAFPELHAELEERYRSPGGLLADELAPLITPESGDPDDEL